MTDRELLFYIQGCLQGTALSVVEKNILDKLNQHLGVVSTNQPWITTAPVNPMSTITVNPNGYWVNGRWISSDSVILNG